MDSTVDNGQAGAWLTLREAADRLGISEKTARRRVKAGQLRGRQAATLHGPAWQVWVDGHGLVATVDGQGTVDVHGGQGTQVGQGVQGPAFLELVRLVDRLHDENRVLAEAATVWQTRSLVLAGQLEQARTELRALAAPAEPAPQEVQNATQEGHRTEEGLETASATPAAPPPAPVPSPPEPNGRGLWPRLRGWLLG